MSTIADSFLADFDSDEEEDEKENNVEDDEKDAAAAGASDGLSDLPEPTVHELDFGEDGEEKKEEKSEASVTGVAALLQDTKLSAHIDLIEKLMKSTEEAETGLHKNVDREAEYPVIVKSNELAVEIDNEIFMIHKFIRDIYALKYSELEQLVPNPLDYAKVVKVIGNETDISKVEKQLADIIPQNTILTISVTATTTIGKPLSEEDLKKVCDACDTVLTLDEHKRKIFTYIESRMSFIAPNLSAIVGSDVAARLMGTAGGLTQLSKIPSCNLQVLGVKRKTIGGLSTARQDLHMGILTQTDVMLTCPPALRQRTIRLLASKCVLAARIDSFFEDATGSKGREMREEVERKVRKWQEPPPPKKKRALPVPNDKPRKKRGGKKYRKYRERYQQTEVQKQKNRMLFGKAEVTDDYTGEGMGMLGQEGSGVLAVKNRDTQKLKDRLSKKTKARIQRVKTAPVAGTASSMAFTPVQGIELVGQRDAVRGSDKYFSNTTTFFKVGSGLKTPAGDASVPKLEAPSPQPRAGGGKKRPAAAAASSDDKKPRRAAPPVPTFA